MQYGYNVSSPKANQEKVNQEPENKKPVENNNSIQNKINAAIQNRNAQQGALDSTKKPIPAPKPNAAKPDSIKEQKRALER
ncbi:MAG: hypothetical protein ACM3MI_00180 [Clostridiales bacterium]